MAGHGAGPSRRSHTKSRKGCKTCKKRHIRCDEIFPQCANCTKHQVRCDYMENAPSDTESQQSPKQPMVMLTPGAERKINPWRQTGSFSYAELQVFSPPQTHEYSKNELRLIHHLSRVSNDLLLNGTNGLTLWTQSLHKFLRIASSYPFVMHGLLSFSANHLAWISQSAETKTLQVHHAGIALSGLHEAISNFSCSNADAVLAASLSLLWQTTVWRDWSSMKTGIHTVVNAMKAWNHESLIAEYITEQDFGVTELNASRWSSFGSRNERHIILQNAVCSLQRLRVAMAEHQLESAWTGQLLDYLQKLQAAKPAVTPEEQFNHLYTLREWLLWVPISLLQRQDAKGPALLTLAHFYGTALSLEPLFPDLGSAFCISRALGPLESIIQVTTAMQSEHGDGQSALEMASLMQFPQDAAARFRDNITFARHEMQQVKISQPPLMSFSTDGFSYTNIGNLSPYIAPTLLSMPSNQGSHSPYLEVALPQSGFTYGTQDWGATPSPGLCAQAYTIQEGGYNNYGSSPVGGFRSGTGPSTDITPLNARD